jgi:hypothetical protein
MKSLPETTVHSQKEILYRNYREGNKAECTKH